MFFGKTEALFLRFEDWSSVSNWLGSQNQFFGAAIFAASPLLIERRDGKIEQADLPDEAGQELGLFGS